MILFSPLTTFADPLGIMPMFLLGAIAVWVLAFAVNLLAGRRVVNGGMIATVTLGTLFLVAFLQHLIEPAPWFGESGLQGEPTDQFITRYLKSLGVPLILSLIVWFRFHGERT